MTETQAREIKSDAVSAASGTNIVNLNERNEERGEWREIGRKGRGRGPVRVGGGRVGGTKEDDDGNVLGGRKSASRGGEEQSGRGTSRVDEEE